MNEDRIRTVDLFAGIGGIRMGFDNAFDGTDTVFVSEFDLPATKTYSLNYDTPDEKCTLSDSLLMGGPSEAPFIYGDITQIDAKKVPDHDILLAGFPCFPAGTPVITEDGLKSIEDIKTGDMVLTHKGRYRKVLSTGKREAPQMVTLSDISGRSLTCTPEHPILWSLISLVPFENGQWREASKCAGGCWYDVVKKQWVYINGIASNTAGDPVDVYNMEVEEDNSYTAHGIAVHNCQAFSMAGKKQGFRDSYKGRTRGTLFFDVARIIDEKKPKVVFCENVKNLKNHDKGRTYKIIKATLEQLGYRVWEKVINSKDFGVPQNRERIYIVAFRADIAPAKFIFPKSAGKPKTLSDILDEAPVPAKYYISETYFESLKRHRARHEAKGHGFGYEIRPLDGIAGTIVCGGMGRERNLIEDPREHSMIPTTRIKGPINSENIRKLTPRECARCQGFPDDFKLELSDAQIYKQVGNSVSIPVIEAIAAEIRKVLEASDGENKGETPEDAQTSNSNKVDKL